MVKAMRQCVEAARRLKVRCIGENPWSGPGARHDTAETSIRDMSFHYPGGSEAVLLIHGLTGTPTEMGFIGRSLAAAGYTVHGVQLAGHCGSESELLRTTWQDWYASVEAAYHRLAQHHDAVHVAGLSMGAVLALHLAAHHPVRGIALYSTTLRYDGWSIPRLSFLLPLFLATPLGERYRFVETFPYGIKDERRRKFVVASMMSGNSGTAGTLGMAGASLRQFRALVAAVKREVSLITAPTLILHASEDDVASVRNAEYVERRLGGPVSKVLLDDCYHIITVDRQCHLVASETVRFFREQAGPTPKSAAAE